MATQNRSPHHTVSTFEDAEARSSPGKQDSITITVQCTRLDDHRPLLDRHGDNVVQSGTVRDNSGETARFVIWKQATPVFFEESIYYRLTNAGWATAGPGASYIAVFPDTKTAPCDEFDSPAHACPVCGAWIGTPHLHHGPEAPEIGWEYLRCDRCGATANPEAVLDGEN
jgi:hypothetical protein